MNTRKMLLPLVLAILLISTSAFALQPDAVESQDIKEADGVTGQDTNTGSGIKTGHIQDGAVTDEKITGPISASKISSTGLDADTVDGKHSYDFADVSHSHDSTYQKKYGKVAIVAQSGSDYTDPVDAMDDISDWCGTPSATNPCLLKIMPGIYNVSSSVTMQPYIDIEGSGENVTLINGSRQGTIVLGADNAEIRSLSIKNSGGGTGNSWGIYNYQSSPTISDVTIDVSGGTNNFGVSNHTDASPLVQNVTVTATGGEYAIGLRDVVSSSSRIENFYATVSDGTVQSFGIDSLYDSSTTAINAHVTVSGVNSKGFSAYGNSEQILTNVISLVTGNRSLGIYVHTDSSASIQRSNLKGGSASIENWGTAGIALSQLDGSFYGSGTYTCFTNYDASLTAVTCP